MNALDGGRSTVALVGCGADGSALAAELEAIFDVVSIDSLEQLDAADPSASSIALWIGTDPAKAVSRDRGALQRALAGAALVLVCPRIRPGDLRVALAAGAAGVVLESEAETALIPTLCAAHAGQVCVPRDHAAQVEPASLSPREKQILGLVVMGYMNCQIAEQLFVAESTVKSHLSSAFGKLGVRSRSEAAELIMDSERGLGMGILGLGGEPVETTGAGA